MGLVTLTFDLLTLKLVRESHQRWVAFLLNLGTLDLLFSNYLLCTRRTDGRTDGRTDTDKQTDKSNAYCPLLYGRGIKIAKLRLRFGNKSERWPIYFTVKTGDHTRSAYPTTAL